MSFYEDKFVTRRESCRCMVRIPGRTRENPLGDLDRAWIDDSNCVLHRSAKRVLLPEHEKELRCGCRPAEGVQCATAELLMVQIHEALDGPGTPDRWARYERLRSWLGRHYQENDQSSV